ncbi:phage morphogenesis protein [Capnocytophaga cynodegmi]|uniref:phage morphogenesis protein n=1 Tax=Capnocytophaga cynodegmi TaxID=28189 RepID=UPI0037D1F150
MKTKDLTVLRKKLYQIANLVHKDIPIVLKVEGIKFIQKNFQDEGFNDGGLEKWKPRKTTDRQGRDITRYRTNRVGKKGNLNRYGSKIKGRAILTGYASGGNKLRHSLKTRIAKNKVTFYTHKEYASRHNEGLDGMPKRQFIGKSRTLDENIKKEIDRLFQQLTKK